MPSDCGRPLVPMVQSMALLVAAQRGHDVAVTPSGIEGQAAGTEPVDRSRASPPAPM
jgi:hypothetical protein